MVVTRAYIDVPGLQRGTEVLAIDGRPVGRILDALLPYSRADGGNDAKRVSNLEVQGYGRYEAFDVFLPLVFPRDVGQPFALEIRRTPGGRVPSRCWYRRFPPTNVSLPRARRKATTNPWTYREVAAGVGLLDMPTWALYNSEFAWESIPGPLFAELMPKGTRDLIIDLRANEGGVSVGDRILAHLIERTCPPSRSCARPAIERYRTTCARCWRPGIPRSTTGATRPSTWAMASIA